MAVYTELDRHELTEITEDYGLVRLLSSSGIPSGSVNTNYLLETARGRHLLRVDEVKGELEVKRELDLLLFLRKHGFPCPQPLADRKGRYYRETGGKCFSVYRYYDGHVVPSERLTTGQLESIGRALADLHTICKSYKKGIDNRFSFERVAGVYGEPASGRTRARCTGGSKSKRDARTGAACRSAASFDIRASIPNAFRHRHSFPDAQALAS